MSLVEAARFGNSLDAGAASALLDAAGIGNVLFDQDMSWVGLGLIPIRLMVLDEDLADAQAALGSP